MAMAVLTLGVQGAGAYTTLSLKMRQQIVRSADLPAPKPGKTIRRAACIDGRLSTVDGRWAMFYLTNTKACVRRFGGASGGAGLLKRSSSSSVDWEEVGEIGETCDHGMYGAPDNVLRDLGCASFEVSARRAPARAAGNRCHSPLLYAPRNGGYALIIDDLRVQRVSCRQAVKVGGAYMAHDPIPAGWRCGISSADYRTYCTFKQSRRRFNFNFEGDAG